ncbi:tRNA (guanine-N(1)-)-methyltransferase [Firmicutes bacterium CAG:884]|nr:tRNA (guanosine(37)-N1)-methyltransferase TrmD [Bacillota bacterium]CCY94623.1 tRNA (guanine-N(1)-)-methyltransferase [Firmicutes bacterium CAG:884]
MRIDILSIFPHMFDGFLNESIIKRAIQKKIVEINIHDFREFSKDPHKKVDDYQFGGGAGMILMPEPIYDCVESIRDDDSYIILMTPQGVSYNQKKANELKLKKHLIIICGHYEGFDERIRALADLEVSIGDYVLTGGELPSMVITDSIVRLLDGAIKEESTETESFNNGLLDYPVYTKPVNFRGMEVPSVLLSGHHENIKKWRYEESLKRTKERRPDILEEKTYGER